jgi:hypothetical protein
MIRVEHEVSDGKRKVYQLKGVLQNVNEQQECNSVG